MKYLRNYRRDKGIFGFINVLVIFLVCFTMVGCNNNENNVVLYSSNNAIIETEKEQEVEEKRESKVQEIKAAIDEVAGEYKDNMAVYYYNFDYDEEYYFNEDRYYLTASLRKIPQIMQVLDKVQAGELTLETEIQYTNDDFADGTGILQFEEEIGSRTIEELIQLSIKESDNIAHNMLERVCGSSLIPYIREIVGDNEIPDGEYKKLTAKHHFIILKTLYENPNNNKYYSKVIELMKDTAFNDSINKYLPEGSVGHKIGSYFRYYHDMGFVFGKENYMLIILTKDIGILTDNQAFSEDEEERNVVDWGKQAWEIIAQISKAIYNIVEE